MNTFNNTKRFFKSTESGASLIIALVFMTGLFLIVTGALRFQRTTAENIAQNSIASKEKWQARARSGRGAGWVISKMPSVYRANIQTAIGVCGNRTLPVFNDVGDTSSPCTNSLLGSIETWLQNQRNAAIAYALNLDQTPMASPDVQISLTEAYRFNQSGSSSGLEKIYVINYLVDSKFNDYGSDTQQGTVVLNPNEGNCNSEVRITVSPSTITLGSSVNITATYWRATELRLYRNNVLIQTQPVIDKSTQQSFTWTDNPTNTGTSDYYVMASETGQCSSSSETQTVTVTVISACTTSLDSFTISSTNVYDGDPVTVSWMTTNATLVTLDNNPVSGSGSQTFIANGTRTFTLRTTGQAPCSPDSRNVTVTSIPRPPSCAFGAPSANLDLVASSVLVNGAFNANWSVSNLANDPNYSNSVVLSGPNGYSQALSGTSGSVPLTAPGSSGSYVYTITATNVCTAVNPPQSSQASDVKTLTVSTSPCTEAVINNFTATPTTYAAGAPGNITFNWDASGDVNNVKIIDLATNATIYNQNVRSGSFSYPKVSSSRTFQIQVRDDCGNTKTSTVVVTVTTSNGSPSCTVPVREYPLQVYSTPTNQYVFMGITTSVSPTGVISGTLEIAQVVSEATNRGSNVTIRDSLGRQVFSQTNSSGGNINFVANPLSPAAPNFKYTIGYGWAGTVASDLSQEASDQVDVDQNGCVGNPPPPPPLPTRGDGGLYYFDSIGDTGSTYYVYDKGVFFRSYNAANGQLIFETGEHATANSGSGPVSYIYNTHFAPTVVDNRDPCFDINGIQLPGCNFTRFLVPNLIRVKTNPNGVVYGEYSVTAPNNSGIPYFEFNNHNYRYSNEELYHN